jgi:hypothetical protein
VAVTALAAKWTRNPKKRFDGDAFFGIRIRYNNGRQEERCIGTDLLTFPMTGRLTLCIHGGDTVVRDMAEMESVVVLAVVGQEAAKKAD